MTKIPYFMTDESLYRLVDDGEEKYGTNYLLTNKGWDDPQAVESFREFLKDDEPYKGFGDEMFERMQAERLYGSV